MLFLHPANPCFKVFQQAEIWTMYNFWVLKRSALNNLEKFIVHE